jgi:3-methyladenine DNA glycosylase/8-oxoguanine DNA glycosylase
MKANLFSVLVQSIVVQRLTVPAGDANLKRLRALLPALTPQSLLAVSPARLRKCGIAAPKVASLRALAKAQLPDVSALSRPKAIAALTDLPGIGEWSAKRALKVLAVESSR